MSANPTTVICEEQSDEAIRTLFVVLDCFARARNDGNERQYLNRSIP